jgi:DNA-binding SARP family transcriptional activator
MIVLRALGNAEIDTGVTILTPSQEMVFAAALYVILERGKHVSRKRLASLLWPQVAEKARAHRLRQTIHQMKKLGIPLEADRDTLRLLKQDVRSDIDELGAPDAFVLSKYQSLEFLPGYSPGLSDEFRDWVDAQNIAVTGSATNVLVQEIEHARHRADWIRVEALAIQCLSFDMYNETAVLAQAEAVAMRGEKHKAVSLLDRFISDVGGTQGQLGLPASLLRRRVAAHMHEPAPLPISDPPFIGRELEMEQLSQAVERAKAGNGSGTLLVGDPGIGKSRLCEELAAFAELQGVALQHVRCRPSDLDRPLSIFVDLVPQLRDLPGALGCAPETFTSLKRLTEFDLRSTESVRLNDSEILFESVRTALFDLLDSVVEEGCLLILIEDIQWLDESSAKIVARMLEWASTRRLLFILNSRSSEASLQKYVDGSRLETRVLGPLRPASAVTLLRSIAPPTGTEADANFIGWGLSVADGNPFFLQELARQWMETGRTHEPTPSISRVLEERLSRLSEEALQVLQCCAVLAEHATLERVEQVLEFQAHKLLSAVEELSRAAMLRQSDGTGANTGQMQSKHDLLSSAAISRLSTIALSFIHRRSADVLEREVAQEAMPTTLLWACATHRHHAGDRERALNLSISCAEHLLDLGLPRDAATAFQKSLDYCTSDEERLRVLPRFAFALQMDGRWEQSKGVLDTCIRLSGKEDPAAALHNDFELLLLEARHQSSFDFSTLLPNIVPCVQSPEASPAHRIRAAVMALKIATDIGPAELIDSLYSDIEPLLSNQELNESTRLEIQIIYSTLRQNDLIPIEYLNGFVESARRTGGELGHFHALNTAASACRISGRYLEGLHFVDRAFKHALEHKFFNRIGYALISAVRLHIAAGAFDKADLSLTELENYPDPAGDSVTQTERLFFDSRIALELGAVSRACTSFEAIERVPLTYSAARRAYYFALGVHVRLQQGSNRDVIEPLVRSLEEAHLRIRGIGGKDFESYALYIGLCALGEDVRASEMLRSYVVQHRRSNWPVPSKIEAVLRPDRGATSMWSVSSASETRVKLLG